MSSVQSIEWVGSLPNDWALSKLKYYLQHIESGGTPESGNEVFWTDSVDGINWVNIGDMSSSPFVLETTKRITEEGRVSKGLRELPVGTVLYSIYATLGAVSELKVPATVNQAILGLVPQQGQDKRYLKYWLNFIRPHLGNYSSSSTQDNLNAQKVKNLPYPAVSLEIQTEISDFLDVETTRIDSLIAEKQKFIDLLKEKRQALISHFVTKKTVNARLSLYCDILPGYAFPSSEFSDNPNDVPLLRGINVGVGELRWNEVVYWNASELHGVQRFLLEPGDIVFGLDRPWVSSGARVAVINVEDTPCLLLQRVARLKAKDGLRQEYLRLLLESDVFYAYFEPELTGISVPHISTGQIGEFKFYLPSAEEQSTVVESYERETRKISALISETENSIELLREHRTALISAAVTGKIDVRRMVDTKGVPA